MRAELLRGFGLRLRELRRRRAWSAERLAHEAALTIGTISRIERARQEPRLSTILALTDTLQISPDALLYPDSQPRRGSGPRHLGSSGGER